MSLYSGITTPGRPDLENIRKLDLLPIPMIRRMQRYGMAIDIPYLNGITADLEREMKDLRDEIACEIPPESLDNFVAASNDIEDWSPINVESGDQLATLLFDILHIGRGKELKRTAGGDRISTGKKQLEVLKREHPVVQLILDYRERSKLKSTYTSKLPKIAKFHPKSSCCPICELSHPVDTWRVHTEITTTRTDTGRFASKNPNLQNIPARTKLGRKVREGFIATPGTRLLSRDFSQIELRLLAHMANEDNLIHIFRHHLDPHIMTAMRAFNISDKSKVDKMLHRAPCKNVNFGIVYGLTETGLYDQMAVTYAVAGIPLPAFITVDWCADFIRQWYGLYPGVEPYMENQHYRARRYGIVWDLFGRIRRVPEVRSVHTWIQSAGLRQSGNMPIQATCAELMKLAMGEVEEHLPPSAQSGIWAWPLMTIHDELLVEVEEDWVESVDELIGWIMDGVTTDKSSGKNILRVPVESDGKIMDRWVKD